MKTVITLSVSLLLCVVAFGQGERFNYVPAPNKFENNTLQSNVNNFTGKLGVSYPLFSYKSSVSNIGFGVSLNYSGGGVLLGQNPSAVGTGWNLDAGGAIFRIIKGLPDDLYNSTNPNCEKGYFYAPVIDPNFCPLEYQGPGSYANPDNKICRDSEADQFYFNFCGKQGTLVIPKNSILTGGTEKIYTIPHTNWDITLSTPNIPNGVTTSITEFVITDDNGVQYWFNALETVQKKTSNAVSDGLVNTPPYNETHYHYDYTYQNEYYATSWKLTKIVDYNGSGDVVNFEYEDYDANYILQKAVTQYKNLGDGKIDRYFDNNNLYKGKLKRLKKVSTVEGTNVIFNYDLFSRCDVLGEKALRSVDVIDVETGNKVNYGFTQTYYTNTGEVQYYSCTSSSQDESLNKWLFLKEIIKSSGAATLKIASFEYLNAPNMPVRKSYLNQDFWGYHNGSETRRCFPTTEYGLTYCQDMIKETFVGSLSRINYPTGGYVEFQYEHNKIKNANGTERYWGGIRTSKITTYDGIDHANDLLKEYKYLLSDGTTSGFAFKLPPFIYQNSVIDQNNVVKNYQVSSSYPIAPIVDINGNPLGYSRVEEILGNGKIVYEYTSFDENPAIVSNFTYPFSLKQYTSDWGFGLLSKQSVLDMNGNTVKTSESVYNIITELITNPAYRSMRMAYQKEASTMQIGVWNCSQAATYYQLAYDIYYPVIGRVDLLGTVEKSYANSIESVTSQEFSYDPVYHYLKKSTSYTSKGNTIETFLFYPYEYSTLSNNYKLVHNRLIAQPISKLSILNKGSNKYILDYKKTDYQQLQNYSVKPWKIYSSRSKTLMPLNPSITNFTPETNYGEATTNLSLDVEYQSYDENGKPLQVSDKGVLNSMIWDNKRNTVIAQTNAPVDQVAYSSFESTKSNGVNVDLGGNWIGNFNGISNPRNGITFQSKAPTGNSTFNFDVSDVQNISLSNKISLISSQKYYLTFWSKSGSKNITGATVLNYRTDRSLDGWTLNLYTLTNISNLQIAGAGSLDELRLIPVGSDISTYTFMPLAGLSSQTDLNNNSVYTEYDVMSRVKVLRDKNKNIVKFFCYSINGQQSNCNEINQLQTVYVKLSYENLTYGLGYTIGDVVFRFYEDQACTIPATVTNLAINYEAIDYCYQYGQGTGSVNGTGSSHILSNVTLYYEEEVYDYGFPTGYYNHCNVEFFLKPGLNYTIVQ